MTSLPDIPAGGRGLSKRACRIGRHDKCTNPACLCWCHRGGVREPRVDKPTPGELAATASP